MNEGEYMVEIVGVIAAFFMLWEWIQMKKGPVGFNETFKELKKQLQKKEK